MPFSFLKRKTNILFFAVILCIENMASALYMPSEWSGAAESSQGGAFTSWANDETSVFFNPAGLSILHNQFSMAEPSDNSLPLPNQLEFNGQFASQMGLNPNSWSNDLFKSSQNNVGKPSYLTLQAFPYLLFSGKHTPIFLIGIPFRSENSMIVKDNTQTNLVSVNSINTTSLALTIADSSHLGSFRWGITFRPNYRSQFYQDTYDYSESISSYSYLMKVLFDGQSTTGLNTDAGFTLSVADNWFPTFGFAIRNLPTGCVENYIDPISFKLEKMCGTVRSGGSESSPNESRIDPTEIRMGVSLNPRKRIGSSIINFRIAADVFPIPLKFGGANYGIPDVELKNLLHVGTQLFFGSPLARDDFSIRFGYQNHTYTWGLAIDLYLFHLGYSSYVAISQYQDNIGNIIQNSERRHLIFLDWQL